MHSPRLVSAAHSSQGSTFQASAQSAVGSQKKGVGSSRPAVDVLSASTVEDPLDAAEVVDVVEVDVELAVLDSPPLDIAPPDEVDPSPAVAPGSLMIGSKQPETSARATIHPSRSHMLPV